MSWVCGMSVSCCCPRLMTECCRVHFYHLLAVARGVDFFFFSFGVGFVLSNLYLDSRGRDYRDTQNQVYVK